MLADAAEAELDDHVGGGGDMELRRAEAGFGEAFFFGFAGVHGHGLCGGGAIGAEDVFFPRNLRAAVGAVEEGFVGGEVAEAELVIRHGEMARGEFLSVFLVADADVAGAPAGVDELPFTVVDLDGVPGVSAVFGRDGLAGLEWRETGAFAVAADDEGLETGFGGEGSEETSVTFADGEAGGKSPGGSRGFDGLVAERDDVVCDIVVEPGEDSTGLVSWGGERRDELGG